MVDDPPRPAAVAADAPKVAAFLEPPGGDPLGLLPGRSGEGPLGGGLVGQRGLRRRACSGSRTSTRTPSAGDGRTTGGTNRRRRAWMRRGGKTRAAYATATSRRARRRSPWRSPAGPEAGNRGAGRALVSLAVPTDPRNKQNIHAPSDAGRPYTAKALQSLHLHLVGTAGACCPQRPVAEVIVVPDSPRNSPTSTKFCPDPHLACISHMWSVVPL